MNYTEEYERWLTNATEDEDVVQELKDMDDAKIEDAFYRNLAFGTGGLRGVIGAGTNRMNIYTVAKASQGLADYLIRMYGETASVSIGFDSRIKSDLFAKVEASVFAANGVKVHIWPELNPVPTVSFATRYLLPVPGHFLPAGAFFRGTPERGDLLLLVLLHQRCLPGCLALQLPVPDWSPCPGNDGHLLFPV